MPALRAKPHSIKQNSYFGKVEKSKQCLFSSKMNLNQRMFGLWAKYGKRKTKKQQVLHRKAHNTAMFGANFENPRFARKIIQTCDVLDFVQHWKIQVFHRNTHKTAIAWQHWKIQVWAKLWDFGNIENPRLCQCFGTFAKLKNRWISQTALLDFR